MLFENAGKREYFDQIQAIPRHLHSAISRCTRFRTNRSSPDPPGEVDVCKGHASRSAHWTSSRPI